MFPVGMCCKCPVQGRRSARGRKHTSPRAGHAFRKHILHVSSCISTLKAGLGSASITERSLQVGLGVQSKLRETKFGKSETSQLGMGHYQWGPIDPEHG